MLLKRCSWIELQKMLLQEKMNMPSLFYHQQGCLKKGQLTNLIFQDLTLFACSRLQIAIRDKDPQPQGKVLMSRSAYAAMQKALKKKYKMKAYKRVFVLILPL